MICFIDDFVFVGIIKHEALSFFPFVPCGTDADGTSLFSVLVLVLVFHIATIVLRTSSSFIRRNQTRRHNKTKVCRKTNIRRGTVGRNVCVRCTGKHLANFQDEIGNGYGYKLEMVVAKLFGSC